ncbi:MAG TPA: histidinol dehydrogenase [Bacteroidales bacterium]|nr:histidinol dehydrogenase [Bacteroidales bacterium]
MKTILYPEPSEWAALSLRPQKEAADLDNIVRNVFDDVKRKGDEALFHYTQKFDGVKLSSLTPDRSMLESCYNSVTPSLREAIRLSASNIEFFHSSQTDAVKVIETSPGVFCRTESRPVEKVGLYIPGGTAPLFSTVLMLAVPARLAGCREVILCTPPRADGSIDPAILYAAMITGVTSIYNIGGIQAIAAMTFGTETVPAVYKIFGPGNQYVTAAKQEATRAGVAIDLPAGPSEVLVIADGTSNPEFVAADLLSQAEHGEDSQVMLVSTDVAVVEKVLTALESELAGLPRRTIAAAALEKSRAVILTSHNECISFSNVYAPEHLIIATDNAADLAAGVMNAGSVFLGHYSCESAGDYASGTNHTLPTGGFARSYSGVSLQSFMKKITIQEISPAGLKNIGPAIITMAAEEGLEAHAEAVRTRLNFLKYV